MFNMRSSVKCCFIGLLGAGIIGCESKAGTGALVGGAGGAAAGGAIGSMSHSRAGEGALIGAAVGALGGALIGHGMDENDGKQARVAEREDYDARGESSNSKWSTHDNGIKQSDVVKWTSQGVRDDIIIDRVERSGSVFHLTAADQNDLREQGVSEPVIRAMKDTGRR